MMQRWIITLLLCAPSAAFANSACDKPVNDFDGLYCLNKVYQEADKELNDNYSKLNGKLDSEGKKALKAGQLAWMRERNQNCSRHEGDQFYVNLDCAAARAFPGSSYLKERVIMLTAEEIKKHHAAPGNGISQNEKVVFRKGLERMG